MLPLKEGCGRAPKSMTPDAPRERLLTETREKRECFVQFSERENRSVIFVGPCFDRRSDHFGFLEEEQRVRGGKFYERRIVFLWI